MVLQGPEHLYWPDLDIDLSVESIEHPERFPLVSWFDLTGCSCRRAARSEAGSDGYPDAQLAAECRRSTNCFSQPAQPAARCDVDRGRWYNSSYGLAATNLDRSCGAQRKAVH
jgi:hypothetical protein